MTEFNANWELSRRRTEHIGEQARRQQEIYEKIPAVWECEEKFRLLALGDARATLEGRKTDSSAERNSLQAEIKRLLTENGYPADYLELQYTCSKCKDEGVIDGQPCTCVKQMKIDHLTRQSGLALHPTDSFDRFQADFYKEMPHPEGKPSAYDNIIRILGWAKDFVRDFDTKKENLLIYGETGLGKTFLSNCIAREILASGHSVLYLTANSLFRDVFRPRRDSEDGEYNELREFVYNADLLILDDLGTETLSEFVRSVVFEVINQRMLDQRSTIISTNLDLPGISDRYTERVLSRIIEHYKLMYLYGANIRYARRKAMLTGQKTTDHE